MRQIHGDAIDIVLKDAYFELGLQDGRMSDPIEASIVEVVSLVEQARKRACEAVGHGLVRVLRPDTCTDTVYGVE